PRASRSGSYPCERAWEPEANGGDRIRPSEGPVPCALRGLTRTCHRRSRCPHVLWTCESGAEELSEPRRTPATGGDLRGSRTLRERLNVPGGTSLSRSLSS